MADPLALKKGVKVRVVRIQHENSGRAWPFQVDAAPGATGVVVTGPFKGQWYLLALDCDPALVGTYRRFVSVTADEVERA